MQRRAGEATGETHEESASLAFYDTDLGANLMVELRGIEPLTSSMPWKRSTN